LAKGLKERVVVVRHAMKNVLIPIVTIIGQQGPCYCRYGNHRDYFNLPGIGLLTLNAVSSRDYVTFEGCLLLYAIVLVVINLITDLAYGLVDPRIHYN